MSIAVLRAIHVSAVALSFAGFAARGLGSFREARWVRHRAARILPHVIDTVLLFSALSMLWVLRLSPTSAPWLEAKISGLVIYILLGSIALRAPRGGRPRRPLGLRVAAWLAALVVFAYIVSVAVTQNPLGILALRR